MKRSTAHRPPTYRTCRKVAKQQIDIAINRAYAELRDKPVACGAFERLLLHIQRSTPLIKPAPGERQLWSDACSYIVGLRNLAFHVSSFIRPIEAWTPSEPSGRKMFGSLANHLLAQYPVPVFMVAAWLSGSDSFHQKAQRWFIEMSMGMSIRKLDVPIEMTSKMEHIFLQCPDHFTIEEAMRYSQLTGLGGSRELTNAVLASRLGRVLAHDYFWKRVIRLFIRSKELNMADVNPIVDFLHHIKIERRQVHTDDGAVLIEPPQPDFSVEGRTIKSILRLAKNWYGDFANANNNSNYIWRKARIRDFHYLEEDHHTDGTRRIWSITELLSGRELFLEGKKMQHDSLFRRSRF